MCPVARLPEQLTLRTSQNIASRSSGKHICRFYANTRFRTCRPGRILGPLWAPLKTSLFWFWRPCCSTLQFLDFFVFFENTTLAQHGDQNRVFFFMSQKCWFCVLLQKHQYYCRGVAKIKRLPLAPHRCEGLQIRIFNTSAVILWFFVMPRKLFFLTFCSETTILLPMRVAATLFRRVKKQRCIVKMLFWLQPGACHYLQCPLNPSQKHVFSATFSVSLRCWIL